MMTEEPKIEVSEALKKAIQEGKKEVFLSNLGLTEIPVELEKEMPDVEILWLTFNQLTDIRILANLPSLKKLYLDSNQISDLSPLTSLPNLEAFFIPKKSDFSESARTDYANQRTTSSAEQCLLSLLSVKGTRHHSDLGALQTQRTLFG